MEGEQRRIDGDQYHYLLEGLSSGRMFEEKVLDVCLSLISKEIVSSLILPVQKIVRMQRFLEFCDGLPTTS